MKKALLVILLMLGVVGAVWAAVGFQNGGSDLGAATVVNCSTGTTCTTDGSTVTIVGATTTSATVTKSLTVGTPTLDGTLGTNFVSVANGVQVDGDIYVDGAIYAKTITEGSALCLTTGTGTGGYLGHCSSTPTNGSCTCVKN